jgi:lipopolysaccharide O-acetyltransferase
MRFRAFGSGARVDFPAFVIGARAIEIGDRALIGRGARLEAHFVREGETRIRIGARTRIAPHVHIGAAGLVEIGAECGIGSYTWITDHDHDTSDPRNSVVAHKRICISPTVIEDGVYIGERVAVLRGVRIGRGSVIGTNSVVLRDVPPYSIAAGVPARVIKRFDPESGAWIHVADAGSAF